MSASGSLQTALAAALQQIPELTGVFDGAPPRAPFPYLVLNGGTESDWSHKSGTGRELMVAVTVWDDQPVRLHALADEVEARVAAVRDVESWQLVSLRLRRRRLVRDVAGPWAAAIDFNARLLSNG